MIKIDENDPIGEVDPSFPIRDVVIRRNTDMKEFYDLQKEIGRGKFGTVYRCTEKSTGLKLAAKFIGISKRQDRRNAEREVEIMRELQHPRLIQMYDAFEINNIMCVVLELIEGGELFERVIDDDFILTEKSVSVFMRQICEGIAFIHSKNILHLDMKPENILCLTRTGNRIKIIDFGLARKYDPEKKLQVLFGTPEFVAPEVVNFDSIGFGTDMWSVGVICYVLLSGLSPFMGETDVQTMANVTIAQYDFDDEAFNDISADAKEFIGKLLLKDREQRMSATECLSHRWLQRRKLPVSSIPPSIPNSQSELDLQKDTLRYLVDRWNNDTNIALVVNSDDDKCNKVIDICKMNGITEHQSKSLDEFVCEPNSLAAKNLRTSAQSAVECDEVKTVEKLNKLESITLIPIQSVVTPPASNQVLKSLPDVAANKPTVNLNKRSLSPDTTKAERSKKELSPKIPKSEASSRSGSNSPAISEQPIFNGEAENTQVKHDEKLLKSLLLDVPQKSPQKQSPDVKKSPSMSPKSLKKPLTKTPSPSIKDQVGQTDKLMTNQEEITTDQFSQKLLKSPSLLELPKKLPQVESGNKIKSPSISPKPSKKTAVKTPSPSIKDEAGQKDGLITNQEEIITDHSSQKLPKSPSLQEIPKKVLGVDSADKTKLPSITNQIEIITNQSNKILLKSQSLLEKSRKFPHEEFTDKTKSPSISPKPLKKPLTKTQFPLIKDQVDKTDGLIINQAELPTDQSSQILPKLSSLLETPKKLPQEESADKMKSPSISPKPLMKTPVKTLSSSIQDQVGQKDETSADPFTQKLLKSQSILEIPKKLSPTESAVTNKSPSTSPKPLKKTPVKTPSPTIKDQEPKLQDEIPNQIEDKTSQEFSKISLLGVPKKLVQTESLNIKKSSSTSPKPLKKKPAKTPSPLIQELQSDHQDDNKPAQSATLEKSPQRDSTGKKCPITTPQPVINFAKVVVNEFQEEVVDKRLSTSDAKICDTVKETPKDTKDICSSPTPGDNFAQGNSNNTKFKDKLQDIPSAEPTSQSSPLRTPTVEISDETYEYVKKRRFTIKSVESTKTVDKGTGDSTSHTKSTEKTTTTESSPQPHRRSIFSPEVSPKVLRKINNFMSTSELMKRRISDISNLLSRRSEHDVEQSLPDEMSSLCSKLNRIVRMRHDSYSIDGSSNFKRPKFRISYFSRDVPLTSTPPLHADLLNYLPFGDDTVPTPVWSFHKTNPFHSDPSSLRNSPERFTSPSLTKKLLSKFFNDSLEYDISSTPSTSTNGLPKDKITGIIS